MYNRLEPPRMSKSRRAILYSFLGLGAILGILFLTPKLNDVFLSAVSGILLAMFVSFLVFPELRDALLKYLTQAEMSPNQKKRLKLAERLRFRQKFFHLTTLPQTITVVSWIIIGIFFWALKIELTQEILVGIMLFSCLPFGFSGLLMILRKEAINKDGQKIYGVGAVINGLFWITLSVLLLLFTYEISKLK